MKNKALDEAPNDFKTIESASDFWDEHDAGDFHDYFQPIDDAVDVTPTWPSLCFWKAEYQIVSKQLLIDAVCL